MPALLIAPSLILLGLGLLPVGWAGRCPRRLASIVSWLAGLQLAAACGSIGLLIIQQAASIQMSAVSSQVAESSTYWFWLADLVVEFSPASVAMFGLVSFVGWVIALYSSRYLDGDSNQARYFKWLAVTAGAVCLMSVSASLLLFGVGWAFSSLGIHRLLLHFGERPGARQAAWTKFVFSRSGDLAVVTCVVWLLIELGTTRFSVLFGEASNDLYGAAFVAWLLCLAACLKSAQFPFHTWLPQTVETPTPVSALMHAGVVNAGGYLLIRVSPFLAEHSLPLQALALVGAVTAVVGSLVMMTQSSIKRALAYSTVSQMGFMLLQCGIGAFAAAFLHILAHSLYKAYAFLSSGSVIAESAKLATTDRKASGLSQGRLGWFAYGLSAALIVVSFGLTLQAFGLHPADKSGGWILCGIICLAFISGVWRAVGSGNRQAVVLSLVSAAGLGIIYVGSYLLVERLVVPLPNLNAPLHLTVIVLGLFLVLFGMQHLAERAGTDRRQPGWHTRLYVHAMNGFYLESLWKRWFGLLGAR